VEIDYRLSINVSREKEVEWNGMMFMRQNAPSTTEAGNKDRLAN